MHALEDGPACDHPRSAEEATLQAPAARATRAAFPVRVEARPPAESQVDLRRTRVQDHVSTILSRSAWLDLPHRVLIEAVYRDNQRVAEIARLLGVGPRALRRRVRRLVARILAPGFVRLAGSLDRTSRLAPAPPKARKSSPWSAPRQQVAEACLLNGRSLRETAKALHLSLHAVRLHRDAARAVIESDLDTRAR